MPLKAAIILSLEPQTRNEHPSRHAPATGRCLFLVPMPRSLDHLLCSSLRVYVSRAKTVSKQRILIGGNIIIAIDGLPIDDWPSYLEFLEPETAVGDLVSLTMLRDRQQITIDVPVGAQP